MATEVYNDSFTTGTTQDLSSYNPDWVKVSAAGTSNLNVQAASDAVFPAGGSGNAVYRWTDVVLGDQRIVATLGVGNDWVGILCRVDADSNAYWVEWDSTGSSIRVYRARGFSAGSPGFWDEVASGGFILPNTTYTAAYVKVTGTNPCAIEVGDDQNGAAAVTFNDTDANRRQSGQPGMLGLDTASFIDDVVIWNESTEATPGKGKGEQESPSSRMYAALVRQLDDEGKFDELDIRNWWG